jgi:hypothetical protein
VAGHNFVVNGTTVDTHEAPGLAPPTGHLYHNNRDGTFRDVTRTAKIGGVLPKSTMWPPSLHVSSAVAAGRRSTWPGR